MNNISSYNHLEIEPKWHQIWHDRQTFRTGENGKEKAYVLSMFPYPSGSGLHVGHLLAYSGSDAVARFSRRQGKDVLFPIGWDAFGLPAENFAIKHGVHPAMSTAENVETYRRQLTQAGISFDWDKEINTSTPEYYRWTQEMFRLLYERGLAYRKDGLVNWCPTCQTVLANEQVVQGACERCGTTVVQRQLKQWYFKITDYAERLLNDLDGLDWPEKIKAMQRNWIGRSAGATLKFEIEGSDSPLEVFTTRADTVFGATYVVLAPEHARVAELTAAEQAEAVRAYQEETAKASEVERTFTDRPKTGVFTGSYAINPATGERLPIWIADYVLASYGTGAVMAVPAHDARDFAFAERYDLPVRRVIEGGDLPYEGDGLLVDSGSFAGTLASEQKAAIVESVGGIEEIRYRLRDWLVSRQRFWGSPIPIAYDAEGNEHLLPTEALPVSLPMDVEFKPTGQSPLATAEEWGRYQDPASGETWQREADTLDTFVCSSWYYLRFPDPSYDKGIFNPEAINRWLPVDTYVGGAEHAVLHLLYARFFTKVLYDAGLVDFEEPFLSLRNQGMILGSDHNKMSKSKGNVTNPDDQIREYGADSLRTYELFMGPFEAEKPWSTTGIGGVKRFLDRFWKLQARIDAGQTDFYAHELPVIHKAIAKVTDDIQNFRFNTAIAALMETLNAAYAQETVSTAFYHAFASLLNPFAPHIADEAWSVTGGEGLCSEAVWPQADERYLAEEAVEYPVQVNGKIRYKLAAGDGKNERDLLEAAKRHPRLHELFPGGFEIVKELVIPGKLISLAIREK